jgi:hypothetical protein
VSVIAFSLLLVLDFGFTNASAMLARLNTVATPSIELAFRKYRRDLSLGWSIMSLS